ncbi:hypothetical protein NGH81_13560, partial [Enterococcus faecalis]|uniref:hypothetical protein n=1 Tax=Enterococcus faecalis TaxID=1351 RepID=UPI002DBFB7AC
KKCAKTFRILFFFTKQNCYIIVIPNTEEHRKILNNLSRERKKHLSNVYLIGVLFFCAKNVPNG